MRYDHRYYDNSSCGIRNHGSACKCYIANSSLINQENVLEKLQADGVKWYAEDGKTIEYKLTEDIYQIQRDIAKKLNIDIN